MSTPASPFTLLAIGTMPASATATRQFSTSAASPLGRPRALMIAISAATAIGGVTDSAGGTWIPGPAQSAAGPSFAMFYCDAGTSPALPAGATITLNGVTTGANSQPHWMLYDIDAGPFVAASAPAQSTANTATFNISVPVAEPDSILFCGCMTNAAGVPGTPTWTSPAQALDTVAGGSAAPGGSTNFGLGTWTGWRSGGPGSVPIATTSGVTAGGTSRAGVIAFGPPQPEPGPATLRLWDGTRWLTIATEAGE